jgi:hypothetical protein
MKSIMSIITAVLFNTVVACAACAGLNVVGVNADPLTCIGVANGIGLLLGAVNGESVPNAIVYSQVLRQIALTEIKTGFYSKTDWLGRARNFDQYVNSDVIKLNEAGVDPEVMWNNNTYPVPIVPREDGKLEYTLDTADTKNTPVLSLDQMLRVDDYRGDVIRSHRDALRVSSGAKAAHAYAPSANADGAPVLATTGGNADIGGSNFKAITYADLIKIATQFRAKKFLNNGGSIICLLHPFHQEQLLTADVEKFKALQNLETGNPTRFVGIDFYEYSDMPLFNRTTLVKKAFNAAPQNTDSPAVSLFFVDKMVFRADGTYKMFMAEDDPQYRADIVGFQKRFLAMPMKNEGIGALVSVSA